MAYNAKYRDKIKYGYIMHTIRFIKFKRDVDRAFNSKFYCTLTCITSDLSSQDKLITELQVASNLTKFKVCKSVHHHTVQINQPTRCENPSSLLLDVYLQLNMFRQSSHSSSGAQQLQQQPLVLPSERGDSSAVGRGRAGRPDHDQQHCYLSHLVG